MSAVHLRVVPWSNLDVHRTIEIASSSTLAELHSAIQRAFALNDDHLHAFFMNGHLWDEEFGVWSDPDPGLPATSSTELRSLELVRNKRFTYLFDFGAEHCFDVRVVDITEEAGSRAGRVTESVGEAKTQYGWLDDEDADEDGSSERGDEADHHAGHVPSPEYADLVRRLEPLVAAWEKREGREHVEDEFDDAFGDELPHDAPKDELHDDAADDARDEDVMDEDTAAEADDGSATLPQEYALALELLERTHANAAEIHVHIEHATETDPMAWLFTLPDRLDQAELFAEAAKLTEQLLPLTPMPSLQAALPRYLASAGRSDESRRALARNSREEPQDPEVLLESGLTWMLLDEPVLAEQSLREALKFAGTDADLRHEVLEALEEVLDATGGDVSALLREEQARNEAFQRARAQRMGLPSAPVRRSEPKVGRNDPCPCGSGKKFKKCCGA